MRVIPRVLSLRSSTALSIAFQKLGQPVPLSNLVLDENRSSAQPTHPKMPARCSSFSGLLNGLSVPSSEETVRGDRTERCRAQQHAPSAQRRPRLLLRCRDCHLFNCRTALACHRLPIRDQTRAGAQRGRNPRTLLSVRVVIPRKGIDLAIGLGLVAIAVVAFLCVRPALQTSSAATESIAVPAPEIDEPGAVGSETAVLAGGCFWGVQGVFQHVKGVTEAESGYTGGDPATAHYETVGTGRTGHVESVRITYDPSQVTYGQLLRIFFSVVQDPTQLNRQGPDVGTQYRSAIFAKDPTQTRIAESYVAQLNRDAIFPGPIVTSVSPKAEFFPAEDYHQDFLNSNPTHSYIAINDMPKVDDLKRLFPESYREQPVLVLADGH